MIPTSSVPELTDDLYARITNKLFEVAGGCWQWVGNLRTGYVITLYEGKHLNVHRAMFEWFRSEIPDGLVIDHLCHNKACVNPWHLEPVTQRENVRRGKQARRR